MEEQRAETDCEVCHKPIPPHRQGQLRSKTQPRTCGIECTRTWLDARAKREMEQMVEPASQSAEATAHENKLTRVERELMRLSLELSDRNEENYKLTSEVNELREMAETTERKLSQSEEAREVLRKENERVQAQVEELEAKLDEKDAFVASHISEWLNEQADDQYGIFKTDSSRELLGIIAKMIDAECYKKDG